MMPRIVKALCVGFALPAVSACNAPDEDALFGGPYPQSSYGGSTSWGAAGGALPTGGALIGGNGGNAGHLGGGGALPTGGRPAAGGFGGSTGGSAGSGGESVDPGFDITKCNLTGAWASYARIPATWPKTQVLLAGAGIIEQWSLTRQEHISGTPVVKTQTYPCGIFLPDLSTQIFVGITTNFGIRFPDSLFDRDVLSPASFEARLVNTVNGPELVSANFALLAGASLSNPVTDAWPTFDQLAPVDDDKDGDVGIRVVSATGPGYAVPPANIFLEPANFIDIAERTVHRFHGRITSCDHFEAELEILTVQGKPAIDSTVVGCVKANGGKCSKQDAKFIDDNRPQFLPDGMGTLSTHRVLDGSNCKDVRAYFDRRPSP